MSDLPPDLIEEILSRVPATSLKRLRSTCKRWKALFKDQRFSEKHFLKAPKESLYLVVKEDRICSISVDVNVVPPSIEFKGGFGLEDPHSNSEQVDITEVFHCDGLLLCNTRNSRLVVWNPCSGETRWIKPTQYVYNRYYSFFSLGYKIEKSCRSYKILRCWKYPRTTDPKTKDVSIGFEIYEFSSNSWRVLDDDMDAYCFKLGYCGLSWKGNTYWLAYDSEEEGYILLCFDFTTERIKRLCLPLSHDSFFKTLSVVREEKISVLSINDSLSKMELWVTNNNVDTEADLSWSKSFAVDLFYPSKRLFMNSNHIIDVEKKVVLSCITYNDKSITTLVCVVGGDDKYYKEIPYMKGNHWPQCYFYVPSLLHIN